MPTENENQITLNKAIQKTTAYRDLHPDATILAFTVGKEIVQNIANQTGCVGFRIYKSLDDAGQEDVVLVGVNKDGEDMCDETQILGNRSIKSPPFGASSPLNS